MAMKHFKKKHNGSFIVSTVIVASIITSAALTFGYLIIPNSPQIIGKSVRRVKTEEKVVALTFDDGPNPPFTYEILDLLEKHDIKATFFVLGERAHEYPGTVQEIYRAGHELGNHTWSHSVLICRSCQFIRDQIEPTDKLLRDLGYEGPIHFRAPKGLKFINLPRTLAKDNREHILFDAVAWDWSSPGKNKIVKNVMKSVKPGSIILLHDGCGTQEQTVPATEIIIEKLKKDGYKFVTISELLKKRF